MDAGNIANPYLGLAQDKLNEYLIEAAQKGNIREILPLVEASADVNAVHSNGSAALLFAAQGGHTSTVTLLIEMGAYKNAKSVKGFTALMFATFGGHLATVKALIKLEEDVNAVDIDGRSALMAATGANDIRITEALINSGADIHLMDSNGWTALTYADVKNHSEIIQLLKKMGAKGPDDNKVIRAIRAQPYKGLTIFYAHHFENSSQTFYFGDIYNSVNTLERSNLIDAHHLAIIKSAFPESFSETPPSLGCLKELFNIVYGMIEKGLKDAQLENKKLLLVVGEQHFILNSLFFHMIFLEAAKSQGIEDLLAEITEQQRDHYLFPPLSEKYLNMTCSIPYAAHALNMKLTAMDMPFEGPLNEKINNLRDAHMSKVALDCDRHAIVFCGISHLKGFNDNLKLKEKHHVVLVDVLGLPDEIRMNFFKKYQWSDFGRYKFLKTSTEVIRLQVKGNMELFSRNEIMDWRNMHKNKYGAQSEPVSIFSSLNQLTSSVSSILTQASTYIPSFFGSSQDNKRKRPEDEVEKNKKARKIRRIGSSSSHSQGE